MLCPILHDRLFQQQHHILHVVVLTRRSELNFSHLRLLRSFTHLHQPSYSLLNTINYFLEYLDKKQDSPHFTNVSLNK